MRAGKLSQRITIQSPLRSQDGTTGAVSESWAALVSDLPADMHPLSGRELLAAASERPDVTTRCVIRHRTDVDTTMRVVHEGLAHNILSVIPDPSYRRHLTLMLSQGLRYDEDVDSVTIIDGGGAAL